MFFNKTLFFLLLCICSYGYSQTDTIYGRIINSKGIPIPNSTISLKEKVLSISDNNGYFIITNLSKQKNIISIRSLGYESLDTLIYSDNKILFEFTLKDKIFEQEKVEVIGIQNLYSQRNWSLLNYVIYEGKIALLYTKHKQRKLGIFNFDGTVSVSLDLEENYNEIKISCTNTLLVLGKERCLEYAIQLEKLIFLKEFEIQLYKKALSTCIGKVDEELLFKRHLEFNKRVYYTKYNRPKEEVVIHQVIDEDALMEAQFQFDSIITIYNQASGGLYSPLNLIRDGLWNGDLKQLIISPRLHKKIAYFLSFEMAPTNVQEYIYGDSLLIMDFVNKKFLELDVKSGNEKTYLLPDFDWKEKYTLLFDQSTNKFYLFSNNTLRHLYKGDQLTLEEAKKINFGNVVHRSESIYDDNLFYISHNYNGRTKFHKIKL